MRGNKGKFTRKAPSVLQAERPLILGQILATVSTILKRLTLIFQNLLSITTIFCIFAAKM